MATLYDQVQSVYSGADTTNPYTVLEGSLDELKASTLAVKNIFSGQPADVDPYKASVDSLVVDIESFKTNSVSFHYNQWWTKGSEQRRYDGNNKFISYQDIPSILTNGDKIVQEVLEESGMPPKVEEETYYYRGTRTWADGAGLLDDTTASVLDLKADIDSIPGGSLSNGKAVIASTTSSLATIETTWTAATSAEYTAWVEAIEYLQAYSYVTFLETGAADPDIQELKGKFSGNLPELD